jgi:uncharacterized protein
MTRFLPAGAYATGADGYRFLPFRFLRWDEHEVLLVNDVGEHAFLDAPTFDAFVTHTLPPSHSAYDTLASRHFLTDAEAIAPLTLLATKYRTKKAFLDGFTKLHLFVVTLRCDHGCPYCQVSRVTEDRTRYDMTPETGSRAIDLLFRSPSPSLKVEFQGGEPLLAFPRIRDIVTAIEERNATERRDIAFVIATNLSPLTDETLAFCKDHQISLSTSLDGPRFLHDANRPRHDGASSYDTTIRHLDRARTVLGADRVSALMTTTARSLDHPREIVDEYAHQGLSGIFLRPISPYGFAHRTGADRAYDTDRFLAFYRTALDHVIALNRTGTPFVEFYTQLVLRKILTPFPTGYVDLQSPAGLGISVVAYNYDGDVYASDEARMLASMGDPSFRLGNVHTSTYEELFGGPTLLRLIAASVTEALPGCATCAFQPYCGADPVFHWATQGDPIGHRPTSAFCRKNMGIFRHVFGLLRTADPFLERLLVRWATDTPSVREPVPCD